MTIKDLIQSCFGKNFAGTFSILYLINKNDVATFPNRKTTEDVGDSISLDGNITLKSGKKFAKVAIVVDSGELIHTAAGTRSAKSYGNTFDFFLIKNITSDEWVNNNINKEFVGIIREKVGVYRVIGDPDNPAQISIAEGKTGNGIDSSKVWTLKLTDATGEVAPYYQGQIISQGAFSLGFSSGFNI